ncbi:amino acid permease [Bradyrhizobium sp. Pa8]|uniref:amino acid permease n=1 Tax=Bradyrhizobium sp. Pa8 TaxID=3386552 RepID=UPI00403F400E
MSLRVALVLRQLSHLTAGHLIALAAVIALPSGILVGSNGQSRLFFVMARDGLLPRSLAKITPGTETLTGVTLLTGLTIALLAGIFSLEEIAELANANTLVAFIAVVACLMILHPLARTAAPIPMIEALRCLRTLTIIGCDYLLFSLARDDAHLLRSLKRDRLADL